MNKKWVYIPAPIKRAPPSPDAVRGGDGISALEVSSLQPGQGKSSNTTTSGM